MAWLSLPCSEGYAAAPVEPRQMLDPLIYEFCFAEGLTGGTEISCPHCDDLPMVPANDPNGEESYQCCQCQKSVVVDWASGQATT